MDEWEGAVRGDRLEERKSSIIFIISIIIFMLSLSVTSNQQWKCYSFHYRLLVFFTESIKYHIIIRSGR